MFKRHLRTLIFAICALILCWMIHQAGPEALWDNILLMRWSLAGCIFVWAIVYMLNAASWRSILNAWGHHLIPHLRLQQITVTGYALNYVTPFGLLGGEPYRVMELKRYTGLEAATSSVLLYAMMHVCSHFILWIIGCVVALTVVPHLSLAIAILMSAISLLCLVLIFLFFRCYSHGMVIRFFKSFSHLPLIGNHTARWMKEHKEKLSDIDDGVTCLLSGHPKLFWRSLSFELASRLVNVFEIVVILSVLMPTVGAVINFSLSSISSLYAEGLVILAFSSLFANLLFFSPLQMGTREGGIFLVLQMLNPELDVTVIMPMAVSISFATRIREFFWIAVGVILLQTNKKIIKT